MAVMIHSDLHMFVFFISLLFVERGEWGRAQSVAVTYATGSMASELRFDFRQEQKSSRRPVFCLMDTGREAGKSTYVTTVSTDYIASKRWMNDEMEGTWKETIAA
jgi:hypothetical protein